MQDAQLVDVAHRPDHLEDAGARIELPIFGDDDRVALGVDHVAMIERLRRGCPAPCTALPPILSSMSGELALRRMRDVLFHVNLASDMVTLVKAFVPPDTLLLTS